MSINIFLSRDEVHAILKNPYVANGARHQVGNRMALDNIRERLALHFDAEASLESRVTRDSYEVHIRMPYRTQSRAGRQRCGDGPRDAREDDRGDAEASPTATHTGRCPARPPRGSNHG